MRRRIRQEYTWSGGWVQTNSVYYIYDGNVVIQERTSSNTLTVTYTRGNDLSGTLQGAGGIGGLLARTDNVAQQTAFYHADGNGNVTMLVNSYQAAVAKYLYDAFGNTLSLSGPLAYANLYRFSSKEAHQNSGLVYYLYRYYDPNLQRWANRDPIGELGFELLCWRKPVGAPLNDYWSNPYNFVLNNPSNNVDLNGNFSFIEIIVGVLIIVIILQPLLPHHPYHPALPPPQPYRPPSYNACPIGNLPPPEDPDGPPYPSPNPGNPANYPPWERPIGEDDGWIPAEPEGGEITPW
jgi:RHS repeat-associated protein